MSMKGGSLYKTAAVIPVPVTVPAPTTAATPVAVVTEADWAGFAASGREAK